MFIMDIELLLDVKLNSTDTFINLLKLDKV